MFQIRKSIYLDNNATTMVFYEVRKRINQVLKKNFGNPSSLYKTARDSAQILESSRKILARTINADTNTVYFFGSASEANNTVIKSLAEYFFVHKKKIISTPVEHSSIIQPLEYLKLKGFSILLCPVDKYGGVDIKEMEKMLDQDTFLICCMLANNEIGTIQDIVKITSIAHAKNILVLCDCVQALGKIKIDVAQLDIDYATFSAHKIHGPKGIGALYVKQNAPISPLIHGGHQERGLRAGTESLHNIAGFAEALKKVDWLIQQHEKQMDVKNYFIHELKKIKPDCMINSPSDNCLVNTISIRFPGINNAVLMGMLDFYGISVSAGSACNSQDGSPSHVLKAIGLSPEKARETVRFSFSVFTTKKDIHYTVMILRNIFNENTSKVMAILPSQLDESVIFNSNYFIFDIRYGFERKLIKSIPNSHEGSFIHFLKYLPLIPKNKPVIIVCQTGYNAAVAAYYLKKNGYRTISFLLGGLLMWKIAHPELYKNKAGQNLHKLIPEIK